MKNIRATIGCLIVFMCLPAPSVVNAAVFVYEKADGSIVASSSPLSEQEIQEKGLQLQSAEASLRPPTRTRTYRPQYSTPSRGSSNMTTSKPYRVMSEDELERRRVREWEERERRKNEEWRRAERYKEEAAKRQRAREKRQEDFYQQQRSLERERAERARQREKAYREDQYQRAWSRKYMDVDIPKDRNINIRVYRD